MKLPGKLRFDNFLVVLLSLYILNLQIFISVYGKNPADFIFNNVQIGNYYGVGLLVAFILLICYVLGLYNLNPNHLKKWLIANVVIIAISAVNLSSITSYASLTSFQPCIYLVCSGLAALGAGYLVAQLFSRVNLEEWFKKRIVYLLTGLAVVGALAYGILVWSGYAQYNLPTFDFGIFQSRTLWQRPQGMGGTHEAWS